MSKSKPEGSSQRPTLKPLQPTLDMDFVNAEIAAGRTPTCPDCHEALTKVYTPGALIPAGYEPTAPEDHRCNPLQIERLKRAAKATGEPGETRIEREIRKASEIVETGVFVNPPPKGDEEDV